MVAFDVAKPPGKLVKKAPVKAKPAADDAPARDIGRLLHYGEAFGATKIDLRMLSISLPVSSGAIALFDPCAPKSWRVLARPVSAGAFRAMLSIARTDAVEKLAALVIHMGRPPIARWIPAERVTSSSGWLAIADSGAAPTVLPAPAPNGLLPVELALPDGKKALAIPCRPAEVSAYWAVDASDKTVCLAIDLDAISAKDWRAK